jgi:hypothetical protein
VNSGTGSKIVRSRSTSPGPSAATAAMIREKGSRPLRMSSRRSSSTSCSHAGRWLALSVELGPALSGTGATCAVSMCSASLRSRSNSASGTLAIRAACSTVTSRAMTRRIAVLRSFSKCGA